jgi:hypothetical protein
MNESPARQDTRFVPFFLPVAAHSDFAAARDGRDAAYAREYDEKYAERLKTELY